jgi:hypothetical protein
MWAFDYQDLRMFFIPFFGAAASGRKHTATVSQRAIVSLMGPLPGIVIGVGLGFLWLQSGSKTLGIFAMLFLAINVFNLLPVMPLDGGRFFETILFSRWPVLKLVVDLATGGLLVAVGFSIRDWILMVLAAFLLLFAPPWYKVSRLGLKLREETSQEDRALERIPEPLVAPLAQRVVEEIALASTAKPKLVASYMNWVWQIVHHEPPRILETIGFLAIYAIVLVALPVAGITAVLIGHDEVIAGRAGEGEVARKVVRLWGFDVWEAELDRDGVFDGDYREYRFLTKQLHVVGSYEGGSPEGTWQLLGPDGSSIAEAVFTAGSFRSGRMLQAGSWSERTFDELPVELRDTIELRQGEGTRIHGAERRER